MNSILYILFSKLIATLYVNVFWKQFIRTQFRFLEPSQWSGADITLERELGRKNFLYNSLTYFVFYWFNRQFVIIYILLLTIGIFFFDIPFN
tara:strand:+ start:120 stop:395 length:276 start_codon:yes stop_codon:yes gene_type:complete